MNIVEKILTKNPCYKAGRQITVKGLMLHSVGCPQPNAMVFVNTWNSTNYNSACVHAFIDGNNGTVYQTLPWNHRGWHAGGSANNTHIGIEMCEPACIKYMSGSNFTCSDIVTAKGVAKCTYDAAVELFAMLCKKYKLNPLADGVIVSHKEGCARGIASNHSDPEHIWKQLNLPYTMNTFRKAVSGKKENDSNSTICNMNKNITDNFVPYQVKVDIPDLVIHKGAGTNYGKTGQYTGKGIFTIVEEAAGKGASMWGKLKSNVGWISLDLCTKM